MDVDLSTDRRWADLNRRVAEDWPVRHEEASWRVYRTVGQALVEILLALGHRFPQKTEILFFRGLSPYSRQAARIISQQGSKIHFGSYRDLVSAEFCSQRVRQGLLAVTYNVDDPLTGRLFNTQVIESAMAGKDVFRIVVSHHYHRFSMDSEPLGPYDIRIYAFSRWGVVGVFGQRAQRLMAYGSTVPWPADSEEQWQRIREEGVLIQDRDAIIQFEASRPSGAQAPLSDIGRSLSASPGRIWDRAVLTWPDIDGDLIINELARDCRRILAGPGQDTVFETASLCRWGDGRLSDWLKEQGFAPEASRGLVVFGLDFIRTKVCDKLVGSVIDRIRQGQAQLL